MQRGCTDPDGHAMAVFVLKLHFCIPEGTVLDGRLQGASAMAKVFSMMVHMNENVVPAPTPDHLLGTVSSDRFGHVIPVED